MANDVLSLDEALTQVGQLLHQMNSQRATLDNPAKSAIRTVWRAVDQTRLHLAAIREGRATRDSPRQELADLWSEASLAILEVDPEFAERLRMKAEYWTDPHEWQDIRGLDISIGSVARAARDLLPHATRRDRVRQPKPQPDPEIFVCHAREDKEDVAKPLADALTHHGYSVWLDKYVLQLGDSLRRSIDAGLGSCRYGVVILSHNFFRKEWPQHELDGLVAMETQDRRKRILPVWHQVTSTEVSQYSPTLADRLGVSTECGMNVVVSAIIDVLEADVDRASASLGAEISEGTAAESSISEQEFSLEEVEVSLAIYAPNNKTCSGSFLAVNSSDCHCDVTNIELKCEITDLPEINLVSLQGRPRRGEVDSTVQNLPIAIPKGRHRVYFLTKEVTEVYRGNLPDNITIRIEFNKKKPISKLLNKTDVHHYK